MPVMAKVIAYTNKADLISKIKTELEALGWTTNSAGPPLIMTTPADAFGRTVCIKIESTTGASAASVIRLNVAGYLTAGDLTAPIITRDQAVADAAGNMNFIGNEWWFTIYTAANSWLMGGMFAAFGDENDDPYPFFCGGSRSTTVNTDNARSFLTTSSNYYQIATDNSTVSLTAISPFMGLYSAQAAVRRGSVAGGFAIACFVGYGASGSLSETRGILPRAFVVMTSVSVAFNDTYTYEGVVFTCVGDVIYSTGVFYQTTGS